MKHYLYSGTNYRRNREALVEDPQRPSYLKVYDRVSDLVIEGFEETGTNINS